MACAGFPSLAIPLGTILIFTAIKDGVEDYRRHLSDKAENLRVVEVVDPDTGGTTKKTWAELQVGMVLRLFDDQSVPTDLVMLHSSNDEGMAYVTTAGLDGETNLKLRKTVCMWKGGVQVFDVYVASCIHPCSLLCASNRPRTLQRRFVRPNLTQASASP